MIDAKPVQPDLSPATESPDIGAHELLCAFMETLPAEPDEFFHGPSNAYVEGDEDGD